MVVLPQSMGQVNVVRLSRSNNVQIDPRFQEDESAAWLGLSQQNALTFETIVLSTGIQTEIVDP
jgi:hypothetical protein